MTTMKRKDYEKPTMPVVKVQVRNQLLAGSTGQGGFSSNPVEEEMP